MSQIQTFLIIVGEGSIKIKPISCVFSFILIVYLSICFRNISIQSFQFILGQCLEKMEGVDESVE